MVLLYILIKNWNESLKEKFIKTTPKRNEFLMKNIYLIITYTGTIPAKLIKLYTKNEYSHISISLDKELTEMYSFARLNPYNFLNARNVT